MNLLLTVDVEPYYTTGTSDPYYHLRNDFKRFLDLLKRNDVAATLFICGVVARDIQDMLSDFVDYFDIGVHTHPEFHPEYRDGIAKLKMYNVEEQFQMIKRDYDMIHQNLGVRPNVFRAGKLAADRNTLQLLKNIDINMDSSLLIPYIFRLQAIKHKPWRVHLQDGVTRIPILAADSRVLEASFKLKNVFIKLLDNGAPVCIMFHSWWLKGYNLAKVERLFSKNRYCNLNDFLKGFEF